MNFRLINGLLACSLLFSANGYAAVKIVECEDENGNRSFQKTCPPGFTEVGSKKFSTGSGSAGDGAQSSSDIQVTMYMIPDCESCDVVREFLQTRNISVTEKDVSEDIELQKELSDLAGSLQVPTTVIGEEKLTGFSRSNFISALKKAGYQEES